MATITVGGDQILNVSSALDSDTLVDVQRFGTLNVLSGGSTIGTIVESAGLAHVSSGGSVTGTKINKPQ
jgi:autotransporter passenger strand-loop-strand repeat protein